MPAPDKFVERRRQYRLPYGEKVIFTDGKMSIPAYCSNMSRGGVFVMTLEPIPINTIGYMVFMLPDHPTSFCVKAKVAHIVFDKQKVEVECGMGVQFQEMNETQIAHVNNYILTQQTAYIELQRVLKESHPDSAQISAIIKKIPTLSRYQDLLSLRYRVDRICTLFENPPADEISTTQVLRLA